MSGARVWRALVGAEHAVVERVGFDEDEPAVVVQVRPGRRQRGRCGIGRRRCRGYDPGNGRRRWRHLDGGTLKVWLEADAARGNCATHGVVVASVPWARHGAGHTRAFDDTAAWLATQSSKSTVCQVLRVAWRTVGAIVTRASAAAAGQAAAEQLRQQPISN